MQTADIEPRTLAVNAERRIERLIPQRPALGYQSVRRRDGTLKDGTLKDGSFRDSRAGGPEPLHPLLDPPHPGAQAFEHRNAPRNHIR